MARRGPIVHAYLPPPRPARPRPRRAPRPRAAAWAAPAGAALLLAALWAAVLRREPPAPRDPGLDPATAPAPGAPGTPAPAPPGPAPWQAAWPTPQTNLADTASGSVYMPTASGRVASALFGSVRTVKRGRALVASFHEGVDIAPVRRRRGGSPDDAVFAAGDGRVGYVNRVAGNSSYGIYVVLLHDDPVGEVFTLYAHLASVPAGLRAGTRVAAGDPVGVMGHTSTLGIPVRRGHLHFELGLVANTRFPQWFRAQRLKPDHGVFNGRNLLGLDPQGLFRRVAAGEPYSLREQLAGTPTAFEVLVRTRRPIDLFLRYPALWRGPGEPGGAIVLGVSEGGVPLSGRRAGASEAGRMGKRNAVVLRVAEDVLGRNGRRLVVRDGAGWRLGPNGERWLEILTY